MGGVVAIHAAQGIAQGEAADIGVWQRQCGVVWLGPQHIAVPTLAYGLQAAPIEQLAQRLIGRVLPLQATGLQPIGQLRCAGEGDPRLTGKLVEHIVQFAGRNRILLADLRGFSGQGLKGQGADTQCGTEQGCPNGLAQAG
ncbi:hypothetical protein D3C79_913170 [compost metagenome]